MIFRQFISSFKKEVLLLIRDVPGLIFLFVLPMLLVLVVTLAQEKGMMGKQTRTDLAIMDLARTPATIRIEAALDSSGFFNLLGESAGMPGDTLKLKEIVGKGDVSLGLIVYSDTLFRIIVDPALNPGLKTSVISSLSFLIQATSGRIQMESYFSEYSGFMDSLVTVYMDIALRKQIAEVEKEMNRQFRSFSGKSHLPWISLDTTRILSNLKKQDVAKPAFNVAGKAKTPDIAEEYGPTEDASLKPTAVQNNVPGFILFAMFFIAIPLSGSMITEKNEGAFMRMKSLPVHSSIILSSKVAVFLIVCLVQFCLMMLMGTKAFPAFFELPALVIGTRYGAIFLATVAASLAAIGFGILVGTFARTISQAALVGSVFVVILGMLSGSFFPIHMMPDILSSISMFSPMRWGIDGYLHIFIRGAGICEIWHYLVLLVVFFILSMMLSIYIFAKR